MGGSVDNVEASRFWIEEITQKLMPEDDYLVFQEDIDLFTPQVIEIVDLSSYNLSLILSGQSVSA